MSSNDLLRIARPAASPAADTPLSAGEWLRYGPFLAHIVIIRRCNLSCGYCNEYDDKSPPVPFAWWSAR